MEQLTPTFSICARHLKPAATKRLVRRMTLKSRLMTVALQQQAAHALHLLFDRAQYPRNH